MISPNNASSTDPSLVSENQGSLSDTEQVLSELLSLMSEDFDPAFFLDNDERIGEFEQLEPVSVRNQSIVLKARDTVLDRTVILKLCRKNSTEIDKAKAIREGQAMAQIDSPYIAKCFSVKVHQDIPYLVIEHIEGETLDAYARRCQPDLEESIRLATQISKGIQAAHQAGVLHLDLKPSNVLVDRSGNCRIIDFGLAHDVESSPTSIETISGTPSFLAPERALGNPTAMPQSDIFGVGAILYFLITGRPPFEGETREEVIARASRAEFPSVSQLGFSVPAWVQSLLDQAMHADPKLRFQTAGQLTRRLSSTGNISRLTGFFSLFLIFLAAATGFGYFYSGWANTTKEGHFLPRFAKIAGELKSMEDVSKIVSKKIRDIQNGPDAAKLNQDLKLEVTLQQVDGQAFPRDVRRSNTYVIPEHKDARLTLRRTDTKGQLHFAIYQISDSKLTRLEPTDALADKPLVLAQDENEFVCQLEDAAYEDDRIEHLLVVVANKSWSLSNQPDNEVRGFGKSKAIDLKLSQFLVPIRVQSVFDHAAKLRYLGDPKESLRILRAEEARLKQTQPEGLAERIQAFRDATKDLTFGAPPPKKLPWIDLSSAKLKAWMVSSWRTQKAIGACLEESAQFDDALEHWQRAKTLQQLIYRSRRNETYVYVDAISKQPRGNAISELELAQATMLYNRATARSEKLFDTPEWNDLNKAEQDYRDAHQLFARHLSTEDFRIARSLLKRAGTLQLLGQNAEAERCYRDAGAAYLATNNRMVMGLPILCDLERVATMIPQGKLDEADKLIDQILIDQILSDQILASKRSSMVIARCGVFGTEVDLHQGRYHQAKMRISRSHDQIFQQLRKNNRADRKLEVIRDLMRSFDNLSLNSLSLDNLTLAESSSLAATDLASYLNQNILRSGAYMTLTKKKQIQQVFITAELVRAHRLIQQKDFAAAIECVQQFPQDVIDEQSATFRFEILIARARACLELSDLERTQTCIGQMTDIVANYQIQTDPLLAKMKLRLGLVTLRMDAERGDATTVEMLGRCRQLVDQHRLTAKRFSLLADLLNEQSQLEFLCDKTQQSFQTSLTALAERKEAIRGSSLMTLTMDDLAQFGKQLHQDVEQLIRVADLDQPHQVQQVATAVQFAKSFISRTSRIQSQFLHEAESIDSVEVTRLRELQSEYANLQIGQALLPNEVRQRLINLNRIRQEARFAKLFANEKLTSLAQAKVQEVFDEAPADTNLKHDEAFIDLVAMGTADVTAEAPLDGHYVALVHTHSDDGPQIRAVKLGGTQVVDSQIEAFRKVINVGDSARGFGDKKAKSGDSIDQLSKLLWKPLAPVLPERVQHLAIHHDGQTGRLAWCLLKNKQQILLESYSFSSTDSLVDSLKSPNARNEQNLRALGIGDIDYGTHIPKLKASAEELQAARRVTKDRLQWTQLTGDQSKETNISTHLNGQAYSVVVFSTHGFAFRDDEQSLAPYLTGLIVADPPAKTDTPNATGGTSDQLMEQLRAWRDLPPFVLTKDTRELQAVNVKGEIAENDPEIDDLIKNDWVLRLANYDVDATPDGLLTFPEIQAMDMSGIELIIGSACQTADGPNVRGAGVVSPATAFHWSGARATLSSLWNLSDQKAQEITIPFLKKFTEKLGTDQPARKAAILREVQLKLYRQGVAPKFWATWTLSGDWN